MKRLAAPLAAVLLGCLGACLGAAPALAQLEDAPSADETEARERFEHGRALIDEGRFSEAQAELETALSLSPRPPIAFNLAVALRGVGAFVSASRTCASLLSETYGALDEAHRAEAEALCGEIRATVAHLEITLAHGPAAEVRLDGALLGTLEDGGARSEPVDPGAHVLALTAPDHDPLHRDVILEPGETVALTLSLEESSGSGDGLGAPVIVVLAVGGVLVLGAIVLAVALATQSSSAAPPGDLPVTETLIAAEPLIRF